MNMSKVSQVMIGLEAKEMFKSYSVRSSIKKVGGFDVFEKRDQSDTAMFSHVCGYFAYYPEYKLKGRPAVFVSGKTLEEIKSRIESVRKQLNF